MPHLKSFWTPIMWMDDIRTGSFAVAFYSIFLSIVSSTLTIYQMLGGESSQMYNPYFEMDIRNTLQLWGTVFTIFFALIIVSAIALIVGIKIENRGLMLPWLVLFGFAVCLNTFFGCWIMYGYYTYLENVLRAFIIWSFAAYNYYCWLCVYSQYSFIKQLQSPNIELLYA